MTNSTKHNHSHAGQTKQELNGRYCLSSNELDKTALPLTKQDEKKCPILELKEIPSCFRCKYANNPLIFDAGKQEGIQIGREQAEKKWKKELDKFYNSDKSVICQFCDKTNIGRQAEQERINKLIDELDSAGWIGSWKELKQKIKDNEN